MEELKVSTVGAQIVLAVRQGANSGQAAVHIEDSGHSGMSAPAWLTDYPDLARKAAALMREAADNIIAQLPG